jgi:hypothetical protein
VALCQARISTKPLWGFSSSNPYHSQSRAEQGFVSNKKTAILKHANKNYARQSRKSLKTVEQGSGHTYNFLHKKTDRIIK